MNKKTFDDLAHVAFAMLDGLAPNQRARAKTLFGPGGRYFAEMRVRFGPERRVAILAIDAVTGAASPLTTEKEKSSERV